MPLIAASSEIRGRPLNAVEGIRAKAARRKLAKFKFEPDVACYARVIL